MYTDENMAKAAAMENKKYKSKYFDKTDVKEIKSLKEAEGWYHGSV